MTVAKTRFSSFEEYLALEPAAMPEGRYEYWDGELIPVMSESAFNDAIANFLFLMLVQMGLPFQLIRPHSCEIEVPGRPRTRIPDLVVLEEAHLTLMARRLTLTRQMPPPLLVVEVVSPGNEHSENYKRDYQDKARQYAALSVLEYWLIDPERSLVLVGALSDGGYEFVEFRGEEPIVSAVFPALKLTAEAVLNAGK
jgi:Uma2 family endonuclease